MKKVLLIITAIILFSGFLCHAANFDDIMKGLGTPAATKQGPDDATTVKGLKDALSVGTKNAVGSVSKVDGYFANPAIKILLPDRLQKVADILGKLGYQKQVDDFILTMNRAAEKAAPKATAIFVDAIKEMSFDDARKILTGDDTAATEYFKSKTQQKLYNEFKPSVSDSMNKVGVAHAYKEMMGKYTSSMPFVKPESMDLDHYVTNKSLDGLFTMVGQEEKNIRTNPAARVTDALKRVFGK